MLSKRETSFILTAFHRLEGFSHVNSETCSHFHDKDFFCKHNNLILDSCSDIVVSDKASLNIHNNILEIASSSKFQEHVTLKFQTLLMKLHINEALLWMISLLIDFHKKSECSEFLTLALKFKLYFYWNVRYFRNEPTTVLETMVEFLNYIVIFKCSPRLFIQSITYFTTFYTFDREDYFYSVLPKVLEFAHELRINIFKSWDIEFRLERLEYSEESVLQNVKRYLLLAKYGYEDRFSSDLMEIYTIFMYGLDKNNLFGIERKPIIGKNMHERDYRPLQVLVLYLVVLCDRYNYGKEMYDRVLYVIWETIPDPYLTLTQLMSSFKQFSHFPEFLKVWMWYSKIVLKNVEFESSPRSLKHLSRCSIRRTLTASVQLPSGVAFLDIPSTLKTYLMCGII